MSNKIWVFIDQFKGHAHPSAWEVMNAGLSLAEKLGGGVTAVVFGQEETRLGETEKLEPS